MKDCQIITEYDKKFRCKIFEDIVGHLHIVEEDICKSCVPSERYKRATRLLFDCVGNPRYNLDTIINQLDNKISKEKAKEALLIAAKTGKYEIEELLKITKNLNIEG